VERERIDAENIWILSEMSQHGVFVSVFMYCFTVSRTEPVGLCDERQRDRSHGAVE